ncbi:MAG: glycosyltransferase [Acidimicrobiales bacterium]|nr:glycosyltransferase [Acidimicrobiales bacterium]
MPARSRPGAGRSFGILTTYPPTACGIATFSAALSTGLVANGQSVGIVRVLDGLDTDDPAVVGGLDNGSPSSVSRAAAVLNRFDVAIVQHEYGLYGGRNGEEVVDLLRALDVPSIVVAHTVLRDPSAHQRQVLEAVADAASVVVVMTDAARRQLSRSFTVDRSKIAMIQHGAATAEPAPDGRNDRSSGPPVLLTWGLLGPGKGIEWAIDAMAQLKDLHPRPRYVVAGRTHPKVAARDGEAYREMLIRRTWANGTVSGVHFDAEYRDLPSLGRLIDSATVVVLPYDSPDQVTSGVLVDAVAAGRPVIATAFPHAVELLASGAGLVVPRRDPDALADALRRVLTEPGLVEDMAAEATRLAPSLGWQAIAAQYTAIGDGMLDRLEEVPA